ncbi:MAG: type II secretion system F family protein [Candidatus Buchananbacteria bacterium]
MKNIDFSKFSKIPATAKIFLLQNLSVMLRAGISLADALKTLSEESKNQKLKKILLETAEKIKQGKSLSESLMPYTSDFGELFVNMIRAGEASGRLEDILNELYIQHKKDHLILSKIRNALTYPVIIIIAMLGIAAFVVVFVLPTITNMFRELNAELPLPTKILIYVSDFIHQNGIYIGIAIVILIFIAIKLGRSKKGKSGLHHFILKIPIISGIIKQVNLARAARSLSSLIKTDIAIVDTLSITSKILGNSAFRQTFAEAAEKVKKGQKLASIFREYPKLFPGIFIQMVAVGEETGALDEVLANLADFYEEEVSQTMGNLPTIIEPVLMLLIGCGVAGIAISILLPIYSMTQNM